MKGAYFHWLHNPPAAHGAGARLSEEAPRDRMNKQAVKTSQLGPRCWEREWGRKRAGHFFLSSSFLFV